LGNKVKKKNILFDSFKNGKGASPRYRFDYLLYDIKKAYQRAIYGYEDAAVFNLDTIFVERYIEIFKQFKNGMGHPNEMSYEEWQRNIQKMIDLLEIVDSEDFDFVGNKGQNYVDRKKLYNDWEQKKTQAKAEFFEMFELFFFDLWD